MVKLFLKNLTKKEIQKKLAVQFDLLRRDGLLLLANFERFSGHIQGSLSRQIAADEAGNVNEDAAVDARFLGEIGVAESTPSGRKRETVLEGGRFVDGDGLDAP